MASGHKAVLPVDPKSPAVLPAEHPEGGLERIRMYGWDSRSKIWHGPSELGQNSVADKRLLRALRILSGSSWYGSIRCGARKKTQHCFFALIHDLSDCGLASIYCHESKAGPTEILAVIPAARRPHLREEFAFEFLAYARFLGALSAGSELQVHDAIVEVLAAPYGSETTVFSISSGLWPGDLGPVLSFCVEKLAVTLSEWLRECSPAQPAV